MNCQILFSGKYIINLSSAELAKRMVKVKQVSIHDVYIYIYI